MYFAFAEAGLGFGFWTLVLVFAATGVLAAMSAVSRIKAGFAQDTTRAHLRSPKAGDYYVIQISLFLRELAAGKPPHGIGRVKAVKPGGVVEVAISRALYLSTEAASKAILEGHVVAPRFFSGAAVLPFDLPDLLVLHERGMVEAVHRLPDPDIEDEEEEGDAMPDYAAVAEKIDAIEAELRRAGYWQEQPLPPEKFEDMGAFGMNTMAFTQWVQFVLIPRVRSILAGEGTFPRSSQVGVQATRESDTDSNMQPLARLLSEFDALFADS